MNASICDHITSDEVPYAGLPDANSQPRYYCPACLLQTIVVLVQTLKPVAVFRLMQIEKQFAREITQAMRTFTYQLKRSNSPDSLSRNRVQCVARYIANAAGLGTSKQERFQRYRVGQDDGVPSYKRTLKHYERAKEPRSLSSFSDVIAFNKRVTA